MKNKKMKIIICISIILLLIVCTLIVISIMKKNKKNESKEEQQKRPDIIIQGTEEKPIELKGFEVTNIDIFFRILSSLLAISLNVLFLFISL